MKDSILSSLSNEDLGSDLHTDSLLEDISYASDLSSNSRGSTSPLASPFQRLLNIAPRSFASMQEFQGSPSFTQLENTVEGAKNLLRRPDGHYDFDTEDGIKACKSFLKQIEKLCRAF